MSVLFYFQFRSIDDLASTSSVVLRQLSQETVDAAAADVEDALKRPHISVLLAVPQSRTDAMDLPAMDAEFRQGLEESPFVEAFYVWSSVSRRARRARCSSTTATAWPTSRATSTCASATRRAWPRWSLPRLQQLLEHKRAIVAFPATIGGRKKYVQAQLRFPNADRHRDRQLRRPGGRRRRPAPVHLPALMKARLATVQHLGGFPQLDLTLRDPVGQVIFSSAPPGASTFVDERSFPLVFFDRELLEYTAPFEAEPETWTLQTGFGNRTIAEIAETSSRPQLVLMTILALVMAAGVLFVAGAAAREVRVAELKSNFVASVSHDLKTPLALIQLFAETLELGRVRTPGTGRRVLPDHQRRGQEADPADREHPRLLADGSRAAALPHGPGRPRRGHPRRRPPDAQPDRAGPLHRDHRRSSPACRRWTSTPARCSRRSRTCSPTR